MFDFDLVSDRLNASLKAAYGSQIEFIPARDMPVVKTYAYGRERAYHPVEFVFRMSVDAGPEEAVADELSATFQRVVSALSDTKPNHNLSHVTHRSWTLFDLDNRIVAATSISIMWSEGTELKYMSMEDIHFMRSFEVRQ